MLRCEVEMTESPRLMPSRISSCKLGMPQLSWAIVFLYNYKVVASSKQQVRDSLVLEH